MITNQIKVKTCIFILNLSISTESLLSLLMEKQLSPEINDFYFYHP